MNRIKYLEEHYEITQSLVGLVSIQTDFEGVQKVLTKWKPLLNIAYEARMRTLCVEQGLEWDDVKPFLGILKESD